MHLHPPKITRECARCRKSFRPATPRSLYCSPECRTGIRTCKGCGVAFAPKRHTRGDFCSRKCWYGWDGRREPKECPVCRVMFKPAYERQTYCSQECKSAIQRKGDRNTECLVCGGFIKPTKNSKSLYCSRKCASLARAENGLEMHGFTAPEGHRSVRRDGYVAVKVNGRWAWEHRLAMEQKMGRPLYPDESVHHVNGDKGDNRIENLELWSTSHPAGQRPDDIAEWAVEMLKRYRPELLK